MILLAPSKNWICFLSGSFLSDSRDSSETARSKNIRRKTSAATQIKSFTRSSLCFFSPGQLNFIPTRSRKRKAPAAQRRTNCYHTSIKGKSEAPDCESLDPPEGKKGERESCEHFRELKTDSQRRSLWVWCTNMMQPQHLCLHLLSEEAGEQTHS